MGRKTLRQRFEDCYTAVPVPADNARGFKIKYIYYAPWYIWNIPEKALKRRKYELLAFSVAGLCLNIGSMLQNAPLNGSPVLFLPFALALCCHVMEFRGVLQFLTAKYKTTKMTYEEVSHILSAAPLFRGILSGFMAAVCMGYGITGTDKAVMFCTALGYALSAATAGWICRQYASLPLIVEDNDSLNQYEAGQKQNG